jgi:hypothetical protein
MQVSLGVNCIQEIEYLGKFFPSPQHPAPSPQVMKASEFYP